MSCDYDFVTRAVRKRTFYMPPDPDRGPIWPFRVQQAKLYELQMLLENDDSDLLLYSRGTTANDKMGILSLVVSHLFYNRQTHINHYSEEFVTKVTKLKNMLSYVLRMISMLHEEHSLFEDKDFACLVKSMENEMNGYWYPIKEELLNQQKKLMRQRNLKFGSVRDTGLFQQKRRNQLKELQKKIDFVYSMNPSKIRFDFCYFSKDRKKFVALSKKMIHLYSLYLLDSGFPGGSIDIELGLISQFFHIKFYNISAVSDPLKSKPNKWAWNVEGQLLTKTICPGQPLRIYFGGNSPKYIIIGNVQDKRQCLDLISKQEVEHYIGPFDSHQNHAYQYNMDLILMDVSSEKSYQHELIVKKKMKELKYGRPLSAAEMSQTSSESSDSELERCELERPGI